MGKRVPNRNAALALAMTRDADLDAGRRKLEEFKKAKDAAKHRDATPSDVESEQKKEKPEKMKKTSDAGKTDDETAAIKAKLVKAVKKKAERRYNQQKQSSEFHKSMSQIFSVEISLILVRLFENFSRIWTIFRIKRSLNFCTMRVPWVVLTIWRFCSSFAIWG